MSEVINKMNLQKIKKKNLIVLYVTNFIHGIVIGFFNSIFQYYIYTNTGEDALLVGVVQSTGFAMMIITMLVSSKLSERFGKKPMIMIGLLLFMIGFLTFYLNNRFYVLILSSMLVWGGFGFVDPSWVGTIAQNTEDKNSGMVYGLIFFFFFGGSIIGSILVSQFSDNYTLESIGWGSSARFFFLISIGGILLEGIIQAIFLNEKAVSQRKSLEKIRNQKKIWKIYFHNKPLLKLLGFFMLDAFVWGIGIQLYSTSLTQGFGLEDADIALYVVLVMNVANMVMQIPAGKLVDKIGPKKSLILSEIMGIIYLSINIIIWFLPGVYLYPLLIVAQIFWGFMIVPFLPAQNKIISIVCPERTTEIYGFMNFCRNILWFGAGYLAGWILDVFGFLGPLIVGLIGVIFELIYLFTMVDEKKLVNLTSVV